MDYSKVLIKKLCRTISATKRQFAALVFSVALGVSLLLGLNTAYKSLVTSLEAFYLDTDIPEYYYEFEPVSAKVLGDIVHIAGVDRAEARLKFALSIKTDQHEKLSATLFSFEKNSESGLAHSIPWGETEILTSDRKGSKLPLLIDFMSAQKYNYEVGDEITLSSKGKEVTGVIYGYCTSPEYISSGEIKLSASRDSVCECFDLPDTANQLLINFNHLRNEQETLTAIEDHLKAVRLLREFERDEHPAKELTKKLMDALKTGTIISPVIIFGIAILFLYVLLSQIIKKQRVQIGIMKALGFSNSHILLFYILYAILLSTAGSLLGIGGAYIIANIVVRRFGEGFYLCKYVVTPDINILIITFLISYVSSLLSAIAASLQIMKINPVEAMRHAPIVNSGKLYLEKIDWFWNKLNEKWHMTLRVISRNKIRFMITTLVITSCIVIIVAAQAFDNSRAELIARTYEKEQIYDYQLYFEKEATSDAWNEWISRYGLQSIEPYLHFDATLRNLSTGKSDKNTIAAIYNNSDAQAIYDKKDKRISVHKGEIVLSHQEANRIHAGIGDEIEVIYRGKTRHFVVADIAYQLITMNSYLLEEDELAFLEGNTRASVLFIKADDTSISKLKKALAEDTNVLSIESKKSQKEYTASMNESMRIIAYGSTIIAILLGAAIIYNACTISFEERKRELSTLRVMGLNNVDISVMLYFEWVLQMLVSFIFGVPIGRVVASLCIQGISTEYYVYPDKIYFRTYLFAIGCTIGFVTISHMMAMQRLKQLTVTEVLKERE